MSGFYCKKTIRRKQIEAISKVDRCSDHKRV